MRLVFLVEERSMKELLEIVLPKILPGSIVKPQIIAHNGKSDLAASIPKKLKAWQNVDDKFIIVHDLYFPHSIVPTSKLRALGND